MLCAGHRSGRIAFLGRARGRRRARHGPARLGRAARPRIATVSLLTALFGMYWDISLHIDVGRDAGPLANPAHYLILAGLFGIFSAGFIADGAPAASRSAERGADRPRLARAAGRRPDLRLRARSR